MWTPMAERVWLLVVPAATLAACDLIVKAKAPASHEIFHHRSNAWVAASACIAAGAVALAWVPSRAVALSAGIAAGGVLGNLVSARWWDAGVPNPFLYETAHATIAFNLADVCIVGGMLALMAALVRTTIQNRHVLPESTVVVRVARHLAGRLRERRGERHAAAEAARAEAEAVAARGVRGEVEPFWELAARDERPS